MSWIPSGPPSPPPLPPPIPAPVSFSGERREFFRLAAQGAGLELFTAGFYRFWLTTNMRRHLWSHTAVDGDAAEYTGRGKELLIGFLVALAIFGPVYLAYFLAGLEAERIKAFASFPLLAFFYVFGQFATYRARRYRLTRTVWRGVRFWMSGSGWAYAGRAALWSLLMLLTLGLILPWREAALERYKMRHSFYGDLQGSFEGRGWEFFKRGWWLWLLAILPVVIPLVLLLQYASQRARFSLLLPNFLLAILFFAAPFVYGAFKAVQWRWWLSGIRFGDVRLESTLMRTGLISLYWKVIGWFLLLFVAFAIYLSLDAVLMVAISGMPFAQFFVPQNFMKSIPLLIIAGVGYLAFVLSLNVVMRVYLMRDLWARVVASTSVHGIDAADDVAAKGDLANALGEGFADGLDVAGF